MTEMRQGQTQTRTAAPKARPLPCMTLSKSYLGQEATVTYLQGQIKCHGHEGKKGADESWIEAFTTNTPAHP